MQITWNDFWQFYQKQEENKSQRLKNRPQHWEYVHRCRNNAHHYFFSLLDWVIPYFYFKNWKYLCTVSHVHVYSVNEGPVMLSILTSGYPCECLGVYLKYTSDPAGFKKMTSVYWCIAHIFCTILNWN